jgi:hypothetical protein
MDPQAVPSKKWMKKTGGREEGDKGIRKRIRRKE